MQKLYTIKEAVEIANVSRQTFYKDIKQKEIKVLNVGLRNVRITEEELEKYVKKKSMTKTKKLNSKYLSIDDVCEILGISRDTLNRMNKKGEIKFTKSYGRVGYKKEDVDAYLRSKM